MIAAPDRAKIGGVPSPPDSDLVPARYLAAARTLALERPVFVPTPLSDVAAAFYSHTGCWNLVLALSERTGLPIEFSASRGHATRAYVVDEDAGRAYGVWGKRQLRSARAGADRLRGPMDGAQLVRELRQLFGDELAALVVSDEMRLPARRAAAFILAAVGRPG
jgi:hypothetical protein